MVYTSLVRRLLKFILPVLVVASMSCESKDRAVNESRNPAEKYGDDVTRAYTGTQRFANQMDSKSLQDAIRSFHTINGRYPSDLEELGHFAGSPLDSRKYEYDPSAGTIKAKQ